MDIHITHIDTACILLEINGYKILTDPVLDQAGGCYHHGWGAVSRKNQRPALDLAELQGVDLVLLSHHQHKDNFDRSGKAFASTVPLILSTPAAAADIKGVTGLNNWQTYEVPTPLVPGLRITATPAQHHPWWLPEFFSGKVIGFVIAFDDQKDGVIYISGDTVFFEGIREVGRRYKIHTSILHVGAARFLYLSGKGRYTMNSTDMIRAVEVLHPKVVIPVHHKGWSHFSETENQLKTVLQGHPQVFSQTVWLASGQRTRAPVTL